MAESSSLVFKAPLKGPGKHTTINISDVVEVNGAIFKVCSLDILNSKVTLQQASHDQVKRFVDKIKVDQPEDKKGRSVNGRGGSKSVESVER